MAGAAALALAVLAPLVGWAPPDVGAAPGPAPTVSRASATEAPDWASDRWGDPWDFDSALTAEGDPDPVLVRQIGHRDVTDVSLDAEEGVLRFTATPGAWGVMPLWIRDPLGRLPYGRDGSAVPLDGATYRRFSMRMFADVDQVASGQIWWHQCPPGEPGGGRGPCEWGAWPLDVQPGWNVYDFEMSPYAGTTLPWTSDLTFLRITPNTPAGHQSQPPFAVAVDWIRAYDPGPGAQRDLVVSGLDPGDRLWVSSEGAESRLPGAPAVEGGRLVDLGALPPGEHRFFGVDPQGERTALSEPVVVAARPQPVVLDPDVAGGDDWAGAVRGDPWDMSSPGDLEGGLAGGVGCGAPSMGAGVLEVGVGTGACAGDPWAQLALGGHLVDGEAWHRLQFRVWYPEPFSLDGAGQGTCVGKEGLGQPCGGMMARLIWDTTNPGPSGRHGHDSTDIVVVPGWQTVTIDMRTDPRWRWEDVASVAGESLGWGVTSPDRRWVSAVRLDPHEDPGGRPWKLDHLAIRRDDRGAPDFDVTFEDRAWAPGTTATVRALDHRGGAVVVAEGVPVVAGVNHVALRADQVPAGTYDIEVSLARGGAVATATSSGPVVMCTSGFPDVPPEHGFCPEITWLVGEGITGGYGDGTFRPAAPVSRGAMAGFLHRAAGAPEVAACAGPPFPDVPVGHPFCREITWLVGEGITGGYGDGTFRPGAVVSRQAMAAFLQRYEGAGG